MKQILILFLLTSTAYGQHFSYRHSASSQGFSMAIPVNTATKGNIYLIYGKEKNQNVMMANYVESCKLWKFTLYGGAGLHFGTRQTMNFKRDANSIFLAGACAIGGIKFSKNAVFIAADITPRVDFPFFGGCEMHKHCGEQNFGNLNFSIGLNIK